MPTPSSRRALWFAFPLVLVLAACNWQRSIGLPDAIEAQQAPGYESADAIPYGVLTDHPCPNIFEPPCADGTGCSPSNNQVVPASAPHDFEWSYSCNPDGYMFILEKLGEAGHRVISANVTSYDASHHGPARTYQWTDGLEQATHYRWTISAFQSDIFPEGYDYVTRNDFWTGPVCEDAESLIAPVPDMPAEGWSLMTGDPSMRVKFSWQYDAPDCVPDGVYGEIALDREFTTGVIGIASGPGMANDGVSVEPLERCHKYYWRVRAYLGMAEWGPWSETLSFRVVPYTGYLSCLTVRDVAARARLNTACRLGPGTGYGRALYIPAGESHPADGRNADGTWIHLRDLQCYVSLDLVDLEPQEVFPGGPPVEEVLSVLPDPPLPETAPEEPDEAVGPKPVCHDKLPFNECLAAGGTPQTGYCACPSG